MAWKATQQERSYYSKNRKKRGLQFANASRGKKYLHVWRHDLCYNEIKIVVFVYNALHFCLFSTKWNSMGQSRSICYFVCFCNKSLYIWPVKSHYRSPFSCRSSGQKYITDRAELVSSHSTGHWLQNRCHCLRQARDILVCRVSKILILQSGK